MLRLVSALGENSFQNLTFVFHGAPEVVSFSIHLHENLIHVPLPFRECAQSLDAFSSGLQGEHRAKPIPPAAHGFLADIDATLVQKVFDIPKRKRKANLHYCG